MKHFVLLCLILLSPHAFAQEEQAPKEEVTEKGELLSRYWLEEPLTLQGSLGFPNHLFSLSSGSTHVDYSPAQVTDFCLTAGYGPFQLSWTLPLPQSAASKSTYGKSSYDDFKFEFGRDRMAASAYYQSFGGFYTDLSGNTGNYARVNTGNDASAGDSFGPSSGGAASTSKPADIVKRPDIHTKHYGAIGWYSFPLKGEGDQAFKITFHNFPEQPSPGFNLDLVTNAFYDRAFIEAGVPLVPEQKASAYQQSSRLLAAETHSLGAGAGLATSYVFESSKFFLDGLFLYGGGAQRQKLRFVDDTRWHTVYVDNANVRMGVNYRGDASTAGFHFWVNTMGSKAEDARLNSSNMALELSYSRTI